MRPVDEVDEDFRRGLRAWLPGAISALGPEPAKDDWEGRRRFDLAWQKALYDAGYAGLAWPVEYGGQGASPARQLAFMEECEWAHAPYGAANYVGMNHAGPTIAAEGTEQQKQQFLPPILKGEVVWCQGFSEPEAGSDLGALRTRAVRDGSEYVVDGHKIWTSHSPVADYCELLVRTDPHAAKHKGISWLAVPMSLPGITVRPMRTLMGSADFAEVFFDGVRVPVANRVGPENDGWRVAMVTLSHERGIAYTNEILNSRVMVRSLVRLAKSSRGDDGQMIWSDGAVRRQFAELAATFEGLWLLLREIVLSDAAPGADVSVVKLRLTEARQQLTELATDICGATGLVLSDETDPGRPALALEYLRSLSLTIAGGTSEIQRTIIGERLAGLPRVEARR